MNILTSASVVIVAW